jgi:rhodanese-related sulfurtransferase
MPLEWKFLSPARLGSNPSMYLIIDVRRPSEYQKCHILNSKNYPLYLFHSHSLSQITGCFRDWGLDLKNKRSLVFHCRLSLVRGPDALDDLFSKIRSENIENEWSNISFWLLEGGFQAWEKYVNEAGTGKSYIQ